MSTIHELLDLSNRVVAITGATGHLGRVIVETLAELNSSLILIDKPGSDFDSVCRVVNENYDVENFCYECNLEAEQSREDLKIKLSEEFGNINGLINNAAFTSGNDMGGWNCAFEKQSILTLRRALEVNLTSVFHLCQIFTPLLSKAQDSYIINVSSIYGSMAPDWELYEGTEMGNPAGYALSKAGLNQLTRWLSTTLAPKIRVNAIVPGGIHRNQPETFVKRYSQKVPLGRMASEEDFKGAVTFLATKLSLYVTGQLIQIDGGWGLK